MGAFSPTTDPHRIHHVHRAAAGASGGFLLVFGAVGAVRSTEFMSTAGPVVLGLFTNGLLSALSVAVGAVLLGAALRSGPAASTVSVVTGILFVASGIVNVLVLNTSMNVLAFGMVNVIFSLLVGTALLTLGSYGRFTGSLPADSPYAPTGQVISEVTGEVTGDLPRTASDGRQERAMAEAERAVALHSATPAQRAGVRAASGFRDHEHRLAAFAVTAAHRS